MNNSIESVLFLIFLILSMIHFYWAFGGKKWIDNVVPVDRHNKKILRPTPFASLIVAFGLLALATLQIILIGRLNLELIIGIEVDRKYFQYIQFFFGIVFFIRAIGDFYSVGFFKKLKDSKFAELDSKYFSPLCLGIATLMFLTIA